MGRFWSQRLVGVVVGILSAVLLAVTATASNFGSNVPAYQTSPHPCDDTLLSQCIANNGYHVYCFGSVAANIKTATRSVMANVYEPLLYVSTAEFACSEPGLDLRISEGRYSYPVWGWTACASGAAYGGSDPYRWCKPQELRWNRSTAGSWDSLSGRAYVACHEVGHSLGLRHSGDSSSCLYPNRITTSTLTAHDRAMLDYYNPANLRATEGQGP